MFVYVAAFISVENTHTDTFVYMAYTNVSVSDLATLEVTINKSLISGLFYYLVGAS